MHSIDKFGPGNQSATETDLNYLNWKPIRNCDCKIKSETVLATHTFIFQKEI